MQGVFVTGTDTNVGKTIVSAALMHRYRGGAKLRYWKPVQTGIEQDDDTATVRTLGECQSDEILDAGVRLPRPLSPHLSAQLAGERIEIDDLMRVIPQDSSGWIVEGAGGVLVPLNESHLIIDLMVQLGLPVVIAARSGLGTINHTLLTLHSIRQCGLAVAGVIMVGSPNSDNRKAIEHYGKVTVLGEMPSFEPLTSSVLKHWAQTELDSDGVLEKLFNV